MRTAYQNEVLVNFNEASNRQAMLNALKAVEKEFGRSYPLVIDGQRIETGKTEPSTSPSDHKLILGHVHCGGIPEAEAAVNRAAEAFKTWQHVEAKDRADCLLKAAGIVRKRKFEFSAWLCYEAGKTWAEADGDTAEAIDFLEYYARQAVRLDAGVDILPYKDENNSCHYIPMGVGIAIAPWNFPLAILVGMVSSAIVTGNTVIMKPALTTSIVAYKFMEVLEEAGLPKGVANLLTGPGALIGEYLVQHPLTRFVNFTGSKEVGLRINRLAAEIAPGQKWIKRVVAEMGGKDAIIVDETADLDAAATGIVASAFGFQGQKCSACSKVVIQEEVYDLLSAKIVERTTALRQGAAQMEGIEFGPVIDLKAFNKINQYIRMGQKESVLLCGGKSDSSVGYFIEPTVFGEVSPRSRLSQEEIFGPVLVLIKAKSYKEAIDIANDTDYGLTGAVYTRDRMRMIQAKRDFHVGNLYINRKCTGALVGVNPFGGFNMSGTDSKAGGPEHLTLFMQLKTFAERY